MKTYLAGMLAIALMLSWTATPSVAWDRGQGLAGPRVSAPHGIPGPHRAVVGPHHAFGRPHGFVAVRGFVGPRIFVGAVPYYYGYPYVYAAPTVVYSEAPSYSAPSVAAVPPSQYWYYCQDPQGYYPHVGECPGGWLQVAPTPPSQ